MILSSIEYKFDNTGKKTHVTLPVEEFEAMLEALEDAEDIREYDLATAEDDGTRISFAEMKKHLVLE